MASLSDDFNRADDADDLGANWTTDEGELNIVSNKAASISAAAFNRGRYTGTALDSSDHIVEADLNDSGEGYVTARQASATFTHYYAGFRGPWGGGISWEIGKVVSGSDTNLDSGTDQGWPDPSTIYIKVDGTTISGKINAGDELSVTDSAISSGTYAGINTDYGDTGQTWDNWTADDLSTDTALVINDSSHSHTADNIALTQQNTLVVQDAVHAHTADNVDLVTAITLVISDGAHGHTAENIDLTQQNTLAIADALHSHTADNVTLDTSALLVIQDAVHSHTADQIALTQANVLAIQDALHAMTADNIDLVQQNVLIIDDALHTLISENVTLTIPTGAVTPRSRSYIIETDDRTFVVMAENRAMIIH